MIHIKRNISLLPYNTFHFDCIAKYFIEISKTSEVKELIKTQIFSENKRLILGGGSNILLTSKCFDGLVIKNNILGKEIVEDTDTYSIIKVGGGENRNEFVRRSIEQGYYGLENLVKIPGTVGASPIQNIGAYGKEVGEYIESIEAINLVPLKKEKLGSSITKYQQGDLIHIIQKQCNFGYRDSLFKHNLKDKVFITHVIFKLPKYNPKTYTPNIKYGAIQEKLLQYQEGTLKIPMQPRNQGKQSTGKQTRIGEANTQLNTPNISPYLIATIISEIRSSKLPNWHQIGTAGSFFKNPIISQTQFDKLKSKFPELKGFPIISSSKKGNSHLISSDSSSDFIKLSAGQLIDLVIGKGYRQGQVGTYEKHALVLVHYGGGNGKEIVQLVKKIQEKVQEKFGIDISPEVNFIE